MRVTHRCGFCDADYPCDTMREVSEDVYRCECESVESCPGCLTNGACESCGKVPATGDGHRPFYCAACEEQWLENYDGPSEPDYDPVTITELSERAQRERQAGRD